MIEIKTPQKLNINVIMFQRHLLVRRTKTDKIGRRYSYGSYYEAEYELSGRFHRFSSSELKWMKNHLNTDINKFPLPLNPCPAIGQIKYIL